MLYCDDETRHAFHQSPTLLQVVCQIYESALAKRGAQVEVMDVDMAADGAVQALLCSPDASPLEITEVVDETNRIFSRTDKRPTVKAHSKEEGYVIVRVTTSSDFAQPQ